MSESKQTVETKEEVYRVQLKDGEWREYTILEVLVSLDKMININNLDK